MKLSERSISALGRVITGDEGISPRRSGPVLVRLFNQYGYNDIYGQGFPSRWDFAEQRIRGLNGDPAIPAMIREVLDPREFIDTDFDLDAAIRFLNQWFKFDGYEVVVDGDTIKVRDLDGSSVECRHPFEGSADEGHLFIDEQLGKADRKIQEGDYDGAITNARTLVEAVLIEIERQLVPNPADYDGDLPKLYKRLQSKLSLSPGQADLETPLRQVLTGLYSCVCGISGLSNRLGDRHARKYKPSKHHAVLAVNAAKTLVNFWFDTHRYQIDRGAFGASPS